MMVRAISAGLLIAGAGVTSLEAHGQVVDGRLLDELTEAPIADGIVLLLGDGGVLLARSLSDGEGVFLFRVEPGRYQLRAMRAGYDEAVTPWVDLDSDEVYPVDVLMQPRAVELDPIEVTVPPFERDLERIGLVPEDVGSRLILREDIDAREAPRDVGDVLAWHPLPGISVIRPDNWATGTADIFGTPRDSFFCVAFPRAGRLDSSRQCALWVLDGRVTTPEIVMLIDPSDVEAMLVLTPPEATQMFGTGAYGGAIAIYTRRGRYVRPRRRSVSRHEKSGFESGASRTDGSVARIDSRPSARYSSLWAACGHATSDNKWFALRRALARLGRQSRK